MTKKDCEALAKELRTVPSIDQYATWIGCVNAVARVLARDPEFDVKKFWKACGISASADPSSW